MWKYAEPKKKKKRPTAGESAATAGGVATGVGLGWGPSRKARAQLGRDIKSGAGKVKSGAGRAKIAGKQGVARAEHAVLITDQKRKTKVMSKRRGKQLIRAARRLKKFAEFAEKERDSKKKRFLKGVGHGAIGATVAGIGLGAVGRRKGIKAVVKRKKALKSRGGRVSARKATGRRDRKYDRAMWGN